MSTVEREREGNGEKGGAGGRARSQEVVGLKLRNVSPTEGQAELWY